MKKLKEYIVVVLTISGIILESINVNASVVASDYLGDMLDTLITGTYWSSTGSVSSGGYVDIYSSIYKIDSEYYYSLLLDVPPFKPTTWVESSFGQYYDNYMVIQEPIDTSELAETGKGWIYLNGEKVMSISSYSGGDRIKIEFVDINYADSKVLSGIMNGNAIIMAMNGINYKVVSDNSEDPEEVQLEYIFVDEPLTVYMTPQVGIYYMNGYSSNSDQPYLILEEENIIDENGMFTNIEYYVSLVKGDEYVFENYRVDISESSRGWIEIQDDNGTLYACLHCKNDKGLELFIVADSITDYDGFYYCT